MAAFGFKAVDRRGRLVTGQEILDDEAALRQLLRRRGLRPVEVSRLRTPRRQDRAAELLLDRLARMISRGLGLDQSLELLARDDAARQLAAVAGRIRERLREGAPFSEALRHVGVQSSLLLAMIRAAEETGQMATVLTALQVFHERRRRVRSELIGSLTYPAVLLVAMVLVLILMGTYIVPTFEDLFVGREAEMPGLTAAVFWVSDSMRLGLPVLLLSTILMAAAILMARRRSPSFRLRLDRLVLGIPTLGYWIARVETGRFLSVLGLLLLNGVTVVRALDLARGSFGNHELARRLAQGEADVRRGRRVRGAIAPALVMSPEEALLLQVGEESGSLPDSCHSLGESIETENSARLQRWLKLLEPAVIVAMGVIVGTVVAGLLLGVYSLTSL